MNLETIAQQHNVTPKDVFFILCEKIQDGSLTDDFGMQDQVKFGDWLESRGLVEKGDFILSLEIKMMHSHLDIEGKYEMDYSGDDPKLKLKAILMGCKFTDDCPRFTVTQDMVTQCLKG